MRILQLTKKVPYPLKDGETLAIHFLSKGIVNNGATVDLLALNTKKHRVGWKEVPEELRHYNKISTVEIDESPKFLRAFKNLFSSKSYNIERFWSEQFANKIEQLVSSSNYQLIQLEGLYLASYIDIIRSKTDAVIVLRSHNLEFEIWNNLSREVKSPLKSWYFNECAKKLKHFEINMIPKVDLVLPISEQDLGKYKNLDSSQEYKVVPVGVDLTGYNLPVTNSNPKGFRIGYVGSLDWYPNIEGVKWFLNKVWPKLILKHPELSFHLAGRGADNKEWTYKLKNYFFYGEVDDAIEFLEGLDVVLVPLFSGSGMRVKIVESLAMSKVVISTPKGFEGIPIKNGYDAYLFHDEHELLDIIGRLSIAKDLDYVRNKARKLAMQYFDYNSIAKDLLLTYKTKIRYPI